MRFEEGRRENTGTTKETSRSSPLVGCRAVFRLRLGLVESLLDLWQATNNRFTVYPDNILLVWVLKTFEGCKQIRSQQSYIPNRERFLSTHSSALPVSCPASDSWVAFLGLLSAKLHHHPISQTSCPWSCSSESLVVLYVCSISSESASFRSYEDYGN